MEYPNFLSVDDLVEQDRDEIQRILFGTSAGLKARVEFALTLENSKKGMKDEATGDQFVRYQYVMQNASGPPLMAAFNPGIPTASATFRPVNLGAPPFATFRPVVHDGSGNPIPQIPAAGHFLPGQHGGYHLVYWPWPIPPSSFAVPATTVANFPPPYHATVAGPRQTSVQHMTPPPASADYQPSINGAAETESAAPASNASSAQVPNAPAIDEVSRSDSLPATIPREIDGNQNEESNLQPTDNAAVPVLSELITNSVPDNICVDNNNIDQANDQKIDVMGECEAENGEVKTVSDRERAALDIDSKGNAQPITEEAQEAKTEEAIPGKEERKSWASLFHNTRSANQAIVTKVVDESYYGALGEDEALQIAIHESTRENAAKLSESSGQLSMDDIWVPVDRDPSARIVADALKKYIFVDKGPTYSIRGITNRGNWCYVNATLQALMSCPTFFHFLRQLFKEIRQRLPSSTPLLDACTRLASEFTLVKDLGKIKMVKGQPMLPPLDLSFMHSIISQLKTDSSFKGHQEDAEEFLLFILNRLHEEMVAALSVDHKSGQRTHLTSGNSNSEGGNGNSEWHQVGAGKKVTLTRQIVVAQSPILHIFAGQLRYGLSRPGAKESANLEPFFTLPLDILLDNVRNIDSALKAFTSREIVKNCQEREKAEVDMTRQVTFHELPRVLILQLKYFEYTEQGAKKNIKPIDYSMDLTIGQEFLSNPSKIPPNERRYKLFAVVFHHGEKAEGGHYTVDVFHAGHWVNIDDTKTTAVKHDHVLSFQPPRVPYLLFYRRFEPDQSQRRSEGPRR